MFGDACYIRVFSYSERLLQSDKGRRKLKSLLTGSEKGQQKKAQPRRLSGLASQPKSGRGKGNKLGPKEATELCISERGATEKEQKMMKLDGGENLSTLNSAGTTTEKKIGFLFLLQHIYRIYAEDRSP